MTMETTLICYARKLRMDLTQNGGRIRMVPQIANLMRESVSIIFEFLYIKIFSSSLYIFLLFNLLFSSSSSYMFPSFQRKKKMVTPRVKNSGIPLRSRYSDERYSRGFYH